MRLSERQKLLLIPANLLPSETLSLGRVQIDEEVEMCVFNIYVNLVPNGRT